MQQGRSLCTSVGLEKVCSPSSWNCCRARLLMVQPVQQCFQYTMINPSQARYLRVVPFLPSVYPPTFVPSPTPCSDPSSGPPYINETAKAIVVISVPRKTIDLYIKFSPPPSRPPQARIAKINSKLHCIPLIYRLTYTQIVSHDG